MFRNKRDSTQSVCYPSPEEARKQAGSLLGAGPGPGVNSRDLDAQERGWSLLGP